MAKSKLTPDDRARIVARYVETTNASQVAQEFKVDEKTVRNVLAALDGRAAELTQEREIDGRGGLEPVRYNDWEVKGIASDF